MSLEWKDYIFREEKMIKYVCDRCGVESEEELWPTQDTDGIDIHLCDDCYEKRRQLLERFMKELQYGKVKS